MTPARLSSRQEAAGSPLWNKGVELHGASAIIEKDLASGFMAEALNADTLLILTSVEKVSLNLGTDKEEFLDELTIEEARRHMNENQFAPGSMLPKFEAGISFIEKGEGRRAIITDISHARGRLPGKDRNDHQIIKHRLSFPKRWPVFPF